MQLELSKTLNNLNLSEIILKVGRFTLYCNISSDLFNLPLAALWTAVLGDWDREVEENSEERIPIEEIILHERFHNYQHDIGISNNMLLCVNRNTLCISFQF